MYPKKVTIENPKLKKLILEKETYVLEGRAASEEIEKRETEMEELDAKIQDAEKSVDISDLNDEANAVTEEFNLAIGKMDTVKTKIYARMKEAVDPKLAERYDTIKKEKEELEEKRNKIALNAQKRRDKIIPLARKEMAKHLQNEYEDYNSIMIEDGVVVGTIFNHLEDWKTSFNKKK